VVSTTSNNPHDVDQRPSTDISDLSDISTHAKQCISSRLDWDSHSLHGKIYKKYRSPPTLAPILSIGMQQTPPIQPSSDNPNTFKILSKSTLHIQDLLVIANTASYAPQFVDFFQYLAGCGL
jgi:hypothetical protein